MTETGTIGPYTILKPLGSGGMGQVFLAHDNRLDRDVALKMLPKAFAQDGERLGLFRREALTLAALNHPNIATIHGFEEAPDGSMALVLEHVEGETLADLLEGGPLPVEKALTVAAQVAEALEAAHERGVVHRDLKPGNIMLGARGLVKVVDFGLAMSEKHRVELEGGAMSGTPGYMSPEQVEGEAQDQRADVFAFGAVLFECLTGTKAFPGESDMSVLNAILFHDPDLSTLPQKTPPRIRDLLSKCLAKDPAERLAEIRTARTEIEEALGIRRAAALRAGETAVATPNNLPRNLSPFVGRDREIEACSALLRTTRLMTLTGVGGCGKTRLSIRLAEDHLAEHADGAWFVDLAPVTDPRDVPATVARALSVREEPGREIALVLADHLAAKRALLILDNCEHLVDACAGLASRLLNASADLKVLATSREPLGIDVERIHPVPTLDLPPENVDDPGALSDCESIRLFVERARQARPGFELTAANATGVAEICRRLDGIPLALELAAARARLLSVEQVRAKLDDRFRLLTGGSKTALPRQQTLLSTIQWSWDILLEPEQRMMASLAAFNGGWTLGTATAICMEHGDEFEVLDLLTRLVDKSLVVVGDGEGEALRYRFLETVRQFARGKLDSSPGADEVRDRHLHYFHALAEAAGEGLTGPDEERWLDDLDQEQANLLAAFEHCRTVVGGVETGLSLASALARFWSARGHYDTGRRTLDEALRRDTSARPGPARGKALVRAGGFALFQGDYVAARPLIEESLAICRAENDMRGMGNALNGLCVVAMYQEDYAAGRAFGEEGLELHRRAGRRRGEALSLHNLGYIAQAEGHLDEARSRYEEALRIFREAGDAELTALTLAAAGKITIREGRLNEAGDQLREALDLSLRLGARREGAYALEGAAELALRVDDPAMAATLCAAAEKVRKDMGSPQLAAERREQEELKDRLRKQLGELSFVDMTRRGGSLSFRDALAQALEWMQTSRGPE